MGGDHQHVRAAPGHAGAAHRRRLLLAAALIGGFFVVELVAGLVTGSLALLSDAAHMFTDVLGLGMALAAIQAATSSRTDDRRTFGLYRLEILAALANAVLLVGVAVWILVEAVRRFGDPPEVLGTPMLVVAVLGLLANLVAFWLLREGAQDSLNVEGAYLEVVADTIGSVGVIVAAVVLQTTGFALIDPIIAVGIGLFVVPRTWRLGGRAVRVLIQAAPPDVDLDAVREDLAAIDGVDDVHDLHVWTLTSGMDVATVHLRATPQADGHAVVHQAHQVLDHRHGITHATVQVEAAAHAECPDCDRATW